MQVKNQLALQQFSTMTKTTQTYRLTYPQQEVLIAWMEVKTNYELLYDLGRTKGVTNADAYLAMATFFAATMRATPSLIKRLDLEVITADFMALKWTSIMKCYSDVAGKKTGNGVNM